MSSAGLRVAGVLLVLALAPLVTSCRSLAGGGHPPASVDELLHGTENPEALPLEASDPGASFDPTLRARLLRGL